MSGITNIRMVFSYIHGIIMSKCNPFFKPFYAFFASPQMLAAHKHTDTNQFKADLWQFIYSVFVCVCFEIFTKSTN